MWTYTNQTELYHWGIKGQKWGVRRYQNEDGSLTSAGKKRYDDTPEEADNTASDRSKKVKTAVVIGTAAAGTALAAYGAYKLSKMYGKKSAGFSATNSALGKIGANKAKNLNWVKDAERPTSRNAVKTLKTELRNKVNDTNVVKKIDQAKLQNRLKDVAEFRPILDD